MFARETPLNCFFVSFELIYMKYIKSPVATHGHFASLNLNYNIAIGDGWLVRHFKSTPCFLTIYSRLPSHRSQTLFFAEKEIQATISLRLPRLLCTPPIVPVDKRRCPCSNAAPAPPIRPPPHNCADKPYPQRYPYSPPPWIPGLLPASMDLSGRILPNEGASAES